LRRLILPLTYFIDKPFQNWKRTTSEIIGTVLQDVRPAGHRMHRDHHAIALSDEREFFIGRV